MVLPDVLMAAAVLVGAAGSACVVVLVDQPEPQPVVSRVVRVVDAGAVEVREGDRVVTVRLANVAAPAADECLYAESRRVLGELLPEGAAVTVEWDGPVAALSTQDGLVNAALVGEGLAVPTAEGTRFLDSVKRANNSAVQQQKGLHSPEVSCTLAGRVKAITEAAAVVEAQSLRAGKAELTVAADTAKSAIGLVEQLAKPGGVTWDAVAPVEQTVLLAKVTKAVPTLYRKEAELRKVVKGLR